MVLRHFTRDLARRLPEWDAPTRLSLAIAIVLLLLLLAMSFAGPTELQFAARVGAFGLLVTIQLLFLWGNRKDISPYHQAQEHFIAGDYQLARTILEGISEADRVSVDALILLGNTYRHLGHLDRSRLALDKALELKPDYHFALFGLGKLNLVNGDYAAAVDHLERALQAGAPDLVQFELGQGYYLRGDYANARRVLMAVRPSLAEQPAQSLMLEYFLFRMGAVDRPVSGLTIENIAFWRDEADKYPLSPYGKQLSRDVDTLTDWRQSAQDLH